MIFYLVYSYDNFLLSIGLPDDLDPKVVIMPEGRLVQMMSQEEADVFIQNYQSFGKHTIEEALLDLDRKIQIGIRPIWDPVQRGWRFKGESPSPEVVEFVRSDFREGLCSRSS